MPSRRPPPVSFDHLAMRIRLWLLLANTAGAAIIFVYLTFIQGSTQGLAASPRDTGPRSSCWWSTWWSHCRSAPTRATAPSPPSSAG